ncbi:MAG: ABC transporter ATP-binding protein [Spirochaetales bacterium]|nr:ABC transporter ATP-binding protein [Spirochaetales bacterium]
MEPVICIDNIKKEFNKAPVLKGISFEVNKGDIFGYLGSNGAGKTTTIRILLDLLKASSGTVSVLGEDVSKPEARMKIGFVLDADGLYNNMTPVENLVFYSRLYGIRNNTDRIESLLSLVDLNDRRTDRVGIFSKGMRQRLALARAMVHDPAVLILDEPMSGIDPPGQMEMRKLIQDVVKNGGKTVLFSSHNLDEVQRICNRIALLDCGELKLYGELSSLMKDRDKGEISVEVSGKVPEGVIEKLKGETLYGFQKSSGQSLIFAPQEGIDVPDIISYLVSLGVKIQGAGKKETSLEEMYSAILREREGA